MGELAPATQAKLLRVLQERNFERSEARARSAWTCAHRRHQQEFRRGSQARDLPARPLYRLNVISLTLPPLRERREDIPLLAYFFAAKYSKKCKRMVNGISPEARACLSAYDWPGNVRELENAVERAVVLANSEVILPDDLPESVLETGRPRQAATNYHDAVNEMKRDIILKAVEQAGGNYTEAARLLGIHPATFTAHPHARFKNRAGRQAD